MVVSDFQYIYAALIVQDRLPSGRYPERNPAHAAYLLPLAEYVRQAVIRGASDMDLDVIATNSDGSPSRRAFMMSRLGGATERIIDPGINIVTERLSRPDGTISEQCVEAMGRWYNRRA